MTRLTTERAGQLALPCLLAAALAGCAGIESAPVGGQDVVEGVAYHLPMRFFQLKVTVADQKVTALDWSTSEAFADPARAFVLRYNAHLIGKTTVKVEVNSKGLLSTANTATTDSIAALGTVQPNKVQEKPSILPSKTEADAPVDRCPANGDYVFVFDKPEQTKILCGQWIDVRIARAPAGAADNLPAAGASSPAGAPATLARTPGIYYRINRAFLATAQAPVSGSKASVGQSKLLLAPNDSPTVLLPFGRTVFAANDGDITLVDGVLQAYEQANDGELAAMLKFPASMLGAYFSAVGNVFNAFTERDTRALSVRQADLKNDILRFKLDRCLDALKKNDTAALQSLQCDALR